MDSAEKILSILDAGCDAYRFPMLDNGYVYLAATRLSLFRSREDWAMVFEVFGFSPRAGSPDVNVTTFSSCLHDRDPATNYVTAAAHENYLANHPHDDSRFFHPVDGDWQDTENEELTATDSAGALVRGKLVQLPGPDVYARHGINLQDPPRVAVFEFCRYLADIARDDVLATQSERRVSVPPEMTQLLQLEEWNHPNVVDDSERPSASETFRQLARVLESGDVNDYRPTAVPNTHWSNWPDGGTL